MPRVIPVAGVLAILLLASFAGLAGAAATPPTLAPGHHGLAEAGAAPHPGRAVAHPAAATGNGTFFTTSSVPAPPASQESCYLTSCVVAADDPSLNLTSTGYLVATYTTWTTEAPCTSARPYAETEVGVVVSTNLGTSWTSPAYLGNPDCTSPAVGDYPSAWEPSLTSLSNGTLVLAYIEYNVSSNLTPGGFAPGLSFRASSPMVTYDRLVVTRSFDGGALWTTPLVLNTSANPSLSAPAFPPQRPVVTATGDTVYVAWMNLSDQLGGFGTGSSAVHLVTSTDGGVTFGAPVDLNTQASAGTSVAMNPSIAVDASGRLYVAYTTNVTYVAVVGCPSSGCYYGGWTASVVVASSTTNGSSFSYTTVSDGVLVPLSRFGPFFDPSPALAVSPSGGQVFVAYSGAYLEALCGSYGCYTGMGTDVSVSNGSTSGSTFSASRSIAPNLRGGINFGGNQLYNPAIGVSPNGVLQITATFDNFSVCALGAYGTFCGPQAQIYVNSTDNGTTFSSPIYLSDNSTQIYLDPNNPDGEYASVVTAGDQVLFAWTADICDAWNTTAIYGACPWPGTGGASGVQISSLFHGTGLTLTFSETGLATGTSWTADILGNILSAVAPANLAVSGVPNGFNATWNVTVATPFGYRYLPTFSLSNPVILTASTTVAVTYTSQVLFDLTTVPFLAPYPYGTPGCGYGAGFFWNLTACPSVNWNITPGPGQEWVTPGTVIPLSVTPNNGFYCVPVGTCYETDILNLTFLSWKGTGANAANTTSLFTNVTVNGPVNETASFSFNGYCIYDWVPVFYTCLGPNETYAFHETGLPTGTDWGVTLNSGTLFQSNQSTDSWNLFNSTLNATLLNYTVWTVPDGNTGNLWVPTASPASPIGPVTDPLVQVNFTLEAATSASFPIYVSTSDLPGGTSWTYSIDSTDYGSSSVIAPPIDVAGGSHSLNASAVVLSNATRYIPSAIDTFDYSGSGIRANFTSFPATVKVQGATYAFINYSKQFWLQVSASSCGTVSASSGWYNSGAAVGLTATPDANCIFYAWSGSGAGSVSSPHASISASVDGPVTEFAIFEPATPPTWNVTVSGVGLSQGTAFTVGIGGQLYSALGVASGAAQFTVHGLSTGVYAVSLPYAYLNGSDGTRFVPSVSSTSLTAESGGYLIDANGWLNLSFSMQFLVNVSASTGGSVAPSGAAWYDSGTILALVATPAVGQLFVGWSGSGLGAATSASASFSITVTGTASEIATFVARPIAAVATFALSVTESGLVAGTQWSAEIGVGGYASTSDEVSALVPNGTVEIALPIVAGPTGVRYVPSPAFTNVTITGAPGSASVVYTAQYYLTLSASAGGSLNVTSGWFANGTVVRIAATPTNSSETFVNWTGVGTGAYTGPSPTVTVTVSQPISESAAFQPVAPATVTTTSSSSSTNGLLISVGLLLALLVVGLVVGFLLLRRRPPREPEAEAPRSEAETMYGDPPAAEP